MRRAEDQATAADFSAELRSLAEKTEFGARAQGAMSGILAAQAVSRGYITEEAVYDLFFAAVSKDAPFSAYLTQLADKIDATAAAQVA